MLQRRVVIGLARRLSDADLALLALELEDDPDARVDVFRVGREALLALERGEGECEDISRSDIVSARKEGLGRLMEDEVTEGGRGGGSCRA